MAAQIVFAKQDDLYREEVLLEQLEYLILHRRTCGKCPGSCLECNRLLRITGELMTPFVSVQIQVKSAGA